MPELINLDLAITVDQVLRAQGAKPAVIRERSPRLVAIAEQALHKGLPLLQPRVLYEALAIEAVIHERLKLEGGLSLRGRLIAQHLMPAQKVVAICCTVGPELENLAADLLPVDTMLSLALEGVGSAAVEALANLVCARFERLHEGQGLQATIPLSPGMVGWPVEEGQPQIFSILEGREIGVTLSPSFMMTPRKSLTMLIGLGETILVKGSTCDYCSVRETCQYKEHYV
jgi:hypothetical protein